MTGLNRLATIRAHLVVMPNGILESDSWLSTWQFWIRLVLHIQLISNKEKETWEREKLSQTLLISFVFSRHGRFSHSISQEWSSNWCSYWPLLLGHNLISRNAKMIRWARHQSYHISAIKLQTNLGMSLPLSLFWAFSEWHRVSASYNDAWSQDK